MPERADAVIERVVEVFAPVAGDGRGRKGSGYLLGNGLVLTARHVLKDVRGVCQIRALKQPDWIGTTVLWLGADEADGALLAVDGPLGHDATPARMGRLAGRDRVECEAIGFPWAQRYSGKDGPIRKTERLVGTIDRFSGHSSGASDGLWVVHIDGSVPRPLESRDSPWRGMSGAGLVCGDLLVGLIVADPLPFRHDRLHAVSVSRLFSASEFLDALTAARGAPATLETVEAQGVLEPPYEPRPTPRARDTSSFLLGAHYGVVPFRTRAEFGHLMSWSHSTAGVDVAVLTGLGGTGKSRLGRQLCHDLAEHHDWVAGPLALDVPSDRLDRLLSIDAPVLAMIDYAESRADEIRDLLARLTSARASGRPRRLLLIARQLGAWWDLLRKQARGQAGRVIDAALRVELGVTERRPQERLAAFDAAVDAFSPYTGPRVDLSEPDLSQSLFDTLLFIHMAALGVLPPGGQELATTSQSIREDLLAAALRREATYWLDMATAVSLPQEVDHRVQCRAVAVATLCAPTATRTPVDEGGAAALLEVLPDLEGVAIRRRVARWLHDLYPARAGWIGPLEPDLLGEALVAETVGEVRELARDLLARVDDETRKRALTVLARGARNHNACRDALADALKHELENLAVVAAIVARHLGNPLGSLLAAALTRHHDTSVVARVFAAVPHGTVYLREVVDAAAGTAYQWLSDGEALDASATSQRAGAAVAPPAHGREDVHLVAYVARLCDEHRLLAAARMATQYWRTDRFDDAGLLHELVLFLEKQRAEAMDTDRPVLRDQSADIVAQALAEQAERILRSSLVATLVDVYDLDGVVDRACRAAGIAGRQPQLAYCLVVLCQKRDPLRFRRSTGRRSPTYELTLGDDGFAISLHRWATTIAKNLREWASTYDDIQAEADWYDISTLKALMRTRRLDDDVANVIADELSTILSNGARLDDMGLELARTRAPSQAEYVFQSPLRQWLNTSLRRKLPPPTTPLDATDARVAALDEPAPRLLDGVYENLIEGIDGLAHTRGLLSEGIERAELVERSAASLVPGNAEDAILLRRFRAELAHVAGELRAEQQALNQMLTYILLAMRSSPKRQRVAILSLRGESLGSAVIDAIKQRMHSIVVDGRPPAPLLIAKVERAVGKAVPVSRFRQLVRLRDDPNYRVDTFVALAALLDSLPTTVPDSASSGAAVALGTTGRAITALRTATAAELRSVDAGLERVFRRYAIRPR